MWTMGNYSSGRSGRVLVGASQTRTAPVRRRPRIRGGASRFGPVDEPFSLVTVISGLAHELRNPLSNLKLNLQLLREDLAAMLADQADNPPQRRILARFETGVSEAGRLERTLEQFLQFASNPKPQLRQTEMIGLVAEMLDFFMPQAVGAPDLRPHGPVRATRSIRQLDPVLFKQALLNLLINAQQAMAGGGELILRHQPHRRRPAVLHRRDRHGPGHPRRPD